MPIKITTEAGIWQTKNVSLDIFLFYVHHHFDSTGKRETKCTQTENIANPHLFVCSGGFDIPQHPQVSLILF